MAVGHFYMRRSRGGAQDGVMAFSPTADRAVSDATFAPAPHTARARRTHLRQMSLRLRVRLTSARLDASLASGETPITEAAALRAARLVSRRERERLAVAVERVCREPSSRPGYSASVPVSADALHLARPALWQLARALRSPGSHRPRGVALTRQLFTEPDSLLYRPPHPGALSKAVREARLALLGEDVAPHLIRGR